MGQAIFAGGQRGSGLPRAASGGTLRLLVAGFTILAAVGWYLVWRQATVVSLQRGIIEGLRQHIEHLNEHIGILSYLESKAARLPGQSRRQLASLLHSQGRRYALDWRLLAAIVEVESNFVPHAESREGARGLMQVRPSTAAEVSTALGLRYRDPADLFDIEVNVQIGTAYLHTLRRRFGSLELALAAYSVGPTRLKAMRASSSHPVRAPAIGMVAGPYAQAVLRRCTCISRHPAQGPLRKGPP